MHSTKKTSFSLFVGGRVLWESGEIGREGHQKAIQGAKNRLVLKVTSYSAEGPHKSVQGPASQSLTCNPAMFNIVSLLFSARSCCKANFDLRERFASDS